MSGKRRLSSTGKWLLDSSGKAKFCSCCQPCPDCCGCYYTLTFSGGSCVEPVLPDPGCPPWVCPDSGEDSGVSAYCDLTGRKATMFLDCLVPSTFTSYAPIEGAPTITGTVDGTSVTIQIEGDCLAQQCVYSGTLSNATCPGGTVELAGGGGSSGLDDYCGCSSTITVTFERAVCPGCCSCRGNCYWIDITGGDEYFCAFCTTEESGLLVVDDCSIAISTLAGWGMAGWAYRSFGEDPLNWEEPSNTLIPEGSWYFIWAAPILAPCDGGVRSDILYVAPLSNTGGLIACPAPGTYTLYPAHESDADLCEMSNTKTLTITKVNCCDYCTDEPYFITCQVVYTEHTDNYDLMTNCDGTPDGVEVCNTSAWLIDEQLSQVESGSCGRESDNTFACYFPFLTDAKIYVSCTDSKWTLSFGDTASLFTPPLTTFRRGLTPEGIYPDVTLCFNDGSVAYQLTITDIAVTS